MFALKINNETKLYLIHCTLLSLFDTYELCVIFMKFGVPEWSAKYVNPVRVNRHVLKYVKILNSWQRTFVYNFTLKNINKKWIKNVLRK